jgi:hypothetical protein
VAKRTVKTKAPKPVKTLGSVFGSDYESVRFTFASKLARLTDENELQDGYEIVSRHIAAGNIVQDGVAGIFPGAPVYRVVKPDAPALI